MKKDQNFSTVLAKYETEFMFESILLRVGKICLSAGMRSEEQQGVKKWKLAKLEVN